MLARFFNSNYRWIVISALLVLGLLTYSNSFNNSFHFDDMASIVDNFAIRDSSNLKAIWECWPTRFITYLTIAFNYHFSGLEVSWYHVFNFAIHFGAAILVWWLTILTLNTPILKNRFKNTHCKVIAFFVGSVFLLQPLQTQPVNYIIQRATLLASFFYIGSVCLYAKSRLIEGEKPCSGISKICYAGALLMAVMSVFSKEMAISLPITIIFYEYSFLKKDFKLRKLLPFLIIILVIPLTMLITKSVDFNSMERGLEYSPEISPLHYFLTQFRVIITYARLLFIPAHQNLDYDFPVISTVFDIQFLLSFLFIAAMLLAGIRLFSKYRLVAFGIIWFFITLLPESSIIPIRDVIFEHRLYLPMVGFSMFLVTGVYYLLQNNIIKFTGILFLLIVSYSIMSYNRNKVWENEITLWSDVMRKSPHKARPYENRGLAYQNQGKIEIAILDYNKAIERDSKSEGAYNNRGTAYHYQGKFQEAINDYDKAIEINPKYSKSYNNKGTLVCQFKSNFNEALGYYNKAIEINPKYTAAYNRGNLYKAEGEFDKSILDYTKAIEIDSKYAIAYSNRGNVYNDQSDFKKAIIDYGKAIAINPDLIRAYNNRALAYFKTGEYNKSWEDVKKVEKSGGKVNPELVNELKKRLGK